MDIADAGLVAEFVIESQEGLANIENQMLTIEGFGSNIDTDLVNAVFRTMHSIKGAAGFLGLDRIGSLAHGLEEVLDDPQQTIDVNLRLELLAHLPRDRFLGRFTVLGSAARQRPE